MSFAALEQYLARPYIPHTGTRVWADAEGRVKGRYFNSTLTSAFQPIRELHSGSIIGHEGFARSYSDSDQGLCVWKLLDHAANDDESVELDRLCRMLHSINFFRQGEAHGGDLYLSVHARLLAAVDGNHGIAFSRILQRLELPQNRVVLQLPVVAPHQGWLLNEVADNYRRNGFRIAVNARDAVEALTLAQRVRPQVIKMDARGIGQERPAARLLAECHERRIRVIFKRVENQQTLDALQYLAAVSSRPLHGQGFLWDLPTAVLAVGKSKPGIAGLWRRIAPRAGVA